MGKKRIAINGFGRIGRLTFRNMMNNPDVDIVAINDLTDNATLAHLLKYDSAHGKLDADISAGEKTLTVNGDRFYAYSERNPADLPWKELDIDVVLECTGFFRSEETAGKHLEAGAKKVVISAPAKGGNIQTIVLGVNDDELDGSNKIFSNASCTTNCLAPVMKTVVDNYGLVQGSMTTIHAYTSDQKIQDAPHSDMRRARAAAYNIVPTSTGAAIAVGKVVPEVLGKLSSIAMRVPIITGSLIEVNCIVEKETTAEEINAAFKKQAEGPMKGILEYCTDPIVSADIVGNQYSSIFDSLMTQANGKMIKLVSWYDNEAGYAARLADMCMRVANL
ncbi:MAG: type I glyceraldehyde-3-phosphate dehydrogenase [Bacteroidia bacterium]|nr:type I glyceraldehyde-3-phosphate dehydrogenase [Bacteroidia bacterium]